MTNKTLFVFGNGFDIAHGMPTKYEHFFYFIEALKIYATEGYDSLQDSEYIQENLNSTISEYLTKVLHPFSKSPIPAYLETIINTLSLNDLENINPWHCYFRDRFDDQIPGVTWIDFETAIKEAVTLFKSTDNSRAHFCQIMQIMHATTTSPPASLEKIYSKLPRSPNLTFDDYTPKHKELFYRFRDETSLYIYHQLLKYAFCFELYLSFYVLNPETLPSPVACFANVFSKEFAKPTSQIIETSLGPLAYPVVPKDVYVLSFNYTKTFEVVYGIDKKVHHIHGTTRPHTELELNMNNPEYQLKTPIVLGFHNSTEDEDCNVTPYLWFEKFYQRILHKTGTEVFQWIANFLDVDKVTSIFIGHSLDSTDRDTIEKIFNSSDLVKIYYHSETVLPGLIANLISIFGKNKIEDAHSRGKIQFIPTY